MATYLTNHLPGRTVQTVDGKEYLWFSGTDYLGMGFNTHFHTYLKEGLSRYGTHFGSSRNNSLRLSIYQEAEVRFAAWQGAQAALLVSSGMLAGQILVREIARLVKTLDQTEQISYHYAPGAHPALWRDGHAASGLQWSEWARQTVAELNAGDSENVHIICTDAVGSPVPANFDLSIFNTINTPAKCWLVIDQSHSLGAMGAGGIGVKEQLSEAILARTLFVSSLNKAMGIPGGIIWGPAAALDFITKSPFYAGASPSSPAYIYAFEQLLKNGIYHQAHQELMDKVLYFSDSHQKADLHFETIPHYPVFCNRDPRLFDFLLEKGIMASCFSYPQPSDPAVTRVVITAAHQQKDLDWLAEVCKSFQY